ncbi:MAG: GNAT family N-acetyltransferase [Chloroflexi bacterium]|nr:GNAT family N-acetyltransferase [Chloroflexota bacterium]
MSIEMRPVTPEEFDTFVTTTFIGFGAPVAPPEDTANTKALCEYDRTLASFDGEEIVSTTGIFSFDMTVPGGSLPTAGVTWVSVKPTHRRKGLLTTMMKQQLSDIRDRNEPIAALWASESVIYGRFGYGIAAQSSQIKIDRLRTKFASQPPATGSTRLLSREEAQATWPKVYDKVLPGQPGMYSRSETWWKHHTLPDKEDRRTNFGGRFYVLYEEDGEPLGYARYRTREGGGDGAPDGSLAVQELMAASDGAYTGLWSYLFGVDLIGTILAHNRRSDEPLYWMLSDPRRLERQQMDSLWVRVVDVPAALEARRYAADIDVVIDVRDSFCDWTEGRYQLEGGPDGATCKRTDADADITLSAADLGAVYMGGTHLSTLARAGRVEGEVDVLRRADAAFGWSPLPWTPEVF